MCTRGSEAILKGWRREVIPTQVVEDGWAFFRQMIYERMFLAKRTAFARGKGSGILSQR